MSDSHNLHCVQVKKLLKKENPAFLFGGKYRFSPYMACGHRCTYCDGRYEKYHVEGDFDCDITVRENAPELLEKELLKLREPGPICISSGISDPYQPVEEKLGITGKCAEILARFNHPVIVHTKSSMILRDIDHWEEVHRRSAFTMMISLTMADDSIRGRVEPGASSVEERLNTLAEFRKRGMNAGVLAMPFIPYLTDSQEQMEELLKALKRAGVQFAMPGLLTLKKGRQKDFFLNSFEKMYPDLTEKMAALYSNEDFYGGPPRGYSNSFRSRTDSLWTEFEMDDLIPQSVYRGQFSLYDEISILLRDMIILYGKRGINVARLKAASLKFAKWLTPRKTYYARRRNLNYSGLEQEVRALTSSGELKNVLGNEKLAEFLLRIVNGAVLNYQTLKLDACPPLLQSTKS
ncbi:MAG: radical SAM protein [Candidatus Sabulitectum sp.]|nr:radical SAM protein [Candidatus Sabulitectum sp.]